MCPNFSKQTISNPPSETAKGYSTHSSLTVQNRTRLLMADPVYHDASENTMNHSTATTSCTALSIPKPTKKKNPHAFDIKRIRKTSIKVVNKEAARSLPSTDISDDTDDDSYHAEEMKFLRTAAAKKLRAAPSRTGTASDPYGFDLKKVRSFIRRESEASAEEHF